MAPVSLSVHVLGFLDSFELAPRNFDTVPTVEFLSDKRVEVLFVEFSQMVSHLSSSFENTCVTKAADDIF